MEYRISYKAQNKLCDIGLENASIDGEIGSRVDRFIYERVSSGFAVDEILKEAEGFFDTKFDDEQSFGLWRCEFWGKLILGAIDVCKYKHNEKLKNDIYGSLKKVLSFQREDGYLSTYRDSENIFPANPEITKKEAGWACTFNWNIWGRKYTLWALIECAVFFDDNNTLNCAEKLALHLIRQIENYGVRLKDTGVMDGMPACSIIKPLLILYRLTGREKYLDFCLDAVKEWEREDGEKPNLITNALSLKAPAHWYSPELSWFAKTYEMLSCFEGIIELYRITGDRHYLEASEAFFTQLKKYELSILGSVGHCAIFGDGAKFAEAGTEICDVIHWMRLCRELLLLTGKSEYAECFENAFLNAFLAGVYTDGRSCAFMVRSHGMHRYATPDVETKYQNCCLNNIPRGLMDACSTAVSVSNEGYYINMYTQGTYRIGNTLIRVSEGYCDKGKLFISVRNPEGGKKIFLRIPEWSSDTRITVGDDEYKPSCGYYSLELSGDTVIRLTFDMTPRLYENSENLSTLPQNDRHIIRWIDPENGICSRELLLKSSVTAVKRGAILLARSKKIGSDEKSMFENGSISAKGAVLTCSNIRHDGFLTVCKVKNELDGKTREFLMCDYASAANSYIFDSRYFTIYI